MGRVNKILQDCYIRSKKRLTSIFLFSHVKSANSNMIDLSVWLASYAIYGNISEATFVCSRTHKAILKGNIVWSCHYLFSSHYWLALVVHFKKSTSYSENVSQNILTNIRLCKLSFIQVENQIKLFIWTYLQHVKVMSYTGSNTYWKSPFNAYIKRTVVFKHGNDILNIHK